MNISSRGKKTVTQISYNPGQLIFDTTASLAESSMISHNEKKDNKSMVTCHAM
uniref:Uncharacterized protein n=1 Tax=Arundo donax TaxID=35708 RepID=A0A0A9AI15_ARUDO